jgi:hypothetical protein
MEVDNCWHCGDSIGNRRMVCVERKNTLNDPLGRNWDIQERGGL